MVGCADLQFPRAVVFSVIWLGCWHEYASLWILRIFVALDAYLTGSICILFFVGYIYWLLTRHIGAKDLRWGMHPWWEPLNGLLMGRNCFVCPAVVVVSSSIVCDEINLSSVV